MTEKTQTTLIERLGGEAAVRSWMERFYGGIARHSLLAPLFPADLAGSTKRQFAFFVQFLGGAPLYNERYGMPFLRYLHRKVRIGRPERDAWMELLIVSLREITTDSALIDEVERKVSPLADDMINHHPDKKDAYFFN